MSLEHSPRRHIPFKKWCKLKGFSESTGRRILKSGKGPKVSRLTEKLVSIREDHDAEWEDARVREATR